MSERKPIGLSVPYRSPAKNREELEQRVAELEATVKHLESIIRKMDRQNLSGKK
jgi:exonuclease VII small subunit